MSLSQSKAVLSPCAGSFCLGWILEDGFRRGALKQDHGWVTARRNSSSLLPCRPDAKERGVLKRGSWCVPLLSVSLVLCLEKMSGVVELRPQCTGWEAGPCSLKRDLHWGSASWICSTAFYQQSSDQGAASCSLVAFLILLPVVKSLATSCLLTPQPFGPFVCAGINRFNLVLK